MKIAVPPQTPHFGLVQGDSTADERAFLLQSESEFFFNTALSYWGQLKARGYQLTY